MIGPISAGLVDAKKEDETVSVTKFQNTQDYQGQIKIKKNIAKLTVTEIYEKFEKYINQVDLGISKWICSGNTMKIDVSKNSTDNAFCKIIIPLKKGDIKFNIIKNAYQIILGFLIENSVFNSWELTNLTQDNPLNLKYAWLSNHLNPVECAIFQKLQENAVIQVEDKKLKFVNRNGAIYFEVQTVSSVIGSQMKVSKKFDLDEYVSIEELLHKEIPSTVENWFREDIKISNPSIAVPLNQEIKQEHPKVEEWQEVKISLKPKKVSVVEKVHHAFKYKSNPHEKKVENKPKVPSTDKSKQLKPIHKSTKKKKDNDSAINKLLNEAMQRNDQELREQVIDFEGLFKDITLLDDKKFHKCFDTMIRMCFKFEKKWEEHIDNAFLFLRKTGLTWNRFKVVESYFKNCIIKSKELNITSAQICKLVFNFSYLMPQNKETLDFFKSKTMPEGSFKDAFEVFKLAVEKGHFVKQRELQGTLGCYFKIEFDFSKHPLKFKEYIKALEDFFIKFINATYVEKVNFYSLSIAATLLKDLPLDVKKEMDYRSIFSSFIQRLEMINAEDDFSQDSLLNNLSDVYKQLPENTANKKEVFQTLYEHVFSLAQGKVCGSRVSDLLIYLINELNYGNSKGLNKIPIKIFDTLIMDGITPFLEHLKDNSLTEDHTKFVFKYLEVPMDYSLFKYCYRKILNSCLNNPMARVVGNEKDSIIFLDTCYRWVESLEVVDSDILEGYYKPYGALLLTCHEIMKKDEIKNSKSTLQIYRKLHDRIHESFMKSMDVKLEEHLTKDVFFKYLSSKETGDILKRIFITTADKRLKSICRWIVKYQSISITIRTLKRLENLIEDKDKLKIAQNCWLEIFRNDENIKTAFTSEDIKRM